jgi:hypothetical protein
VTTNGLEHFCNDELEKAQQQWRMAARWLALKPKILIFRKLWRDLQSAMFV